DGGSSGSATVSFDHVLVTEGTTPYVSSVTPLVGGVGTSVTITGSNFGAMQGSSLVEFNNVAASSITSWSDSQIVAAVPATVPTGTGPVTVTVNSIVSNGNKMFTSLDPVLTSVSPPNAAVGATVTVAGTGLTLNGQATTVKFNGVAGQILSASSTSITV